MKMCICSQIFEMTVSIVTFITGGIILRVEMWLYYFYKQMDEIINNDSKVSVEFVCIEVLF